MNQDEAVTLLSKMQVFWPQQERDDAQNALWLQKFASVRDADKANQAIMELVDLTPFWPHVSEFMRQYNAAVASKSVSWTSKARTGRCPVCDDTGWLQASADDNSVYPCSNCRPEQYERWTSGKMTGRTDLDDRFDSRLP